MADLATWITGGISAIAAVVAVYFAARADRAQRTAVVAQQEAAAAAREAAESADKAQRINIRPALHLQLSKQQGSSFFGTELAVELRVSNVGHGTAVIDCVKLFQYGNPGIEYHDTSGFEQKLREQFDEKIFVPLVGHRMEMAAAVLTLPALTDSTRALEAGATRTVFTLKFGMAGPNIRTRFNEGLTAQVVYRSMAGDLFNTEQQFADLRESEVSMPDEAEIP